MVKLRRLTAVTLSSALVAAGALLASPAAHAVSPAFHEVGLYGTTDPTYDGVYRQSLAILGLEAAGRTPAPEAVQWLLNQQCPDGGFSSYKSTVACPAFDSVAFTGGRDSNATAMAVSALEWIGTPASIAAATKAATYLRGVQQSDGGWELYPGSGLGTDPNSTGLVLLALDAAGLSAANPTHTVAEYYQGMQLGWTNFAGTPTANLGGIITPWDLLTPNDFASVQSIPGLRAARLTALGAVSPAEWQDGDRAPLTAAPPMTRADEGAWAASWLEAHITDPATFASTHPTNAAWAVISLASDLTGENTAHALETALSGLPADPSPAANGQYALAALTVRDSAALQTYATRISASLTRDTTAPTAVWSTTGTTDPRARVVALTRSALSDRFWPTARLHTVITWGDGTHTTVAPSTTSVRHVYAASGHHAISVAVTDPSGNRSIRTDVGAPAAVVLTPAHPAARASWSTVNVRATDVGTGVRAVRVRLAQDRHGGWVSWNGTHWVAGLGAWVYVTHVTGTNRWAVPTSALSLGRFSITAYAVDRSGITGPRSVVSTTLVR